MLGENAPLTASPNLRIAFRKRPSLVSYVWYPSWSQRSSTASFSKAQRPKKSPSVNPDVPRRPWPPRPRPLPPPPPRPPSPKPLKVRSWLILGGKYRIKNVQLLGSSQSQGQAVAGSDRSCVASRARARTSGLLAFFRSVKVDRRVLVLSPSLARALAQRVHG
jgi:hypothetical protein